MAILRGLKDQLLTDRRLRIGEASMVDAEGVMVDGDEEIEVYYAVLIENSATALPRENNATAPTRDATTETDQDSFALKLGIQNECFVNANTGLPLDEGFCRAASKKEIDDFKSKGAGK